ncbi:MAG: HlyD family secretion protein [Phocaeicola sp.]
MKSLYCLFAISSLLLSCSNHSNKYDASGVFETTEVIVSARTAGELISFNLVEGDLIESEQIVGCIDTTQLYLKKEQLLANMRALNSRYYDVSRQVAATKQQLETQRKEEMRFRKLIELNAANQKQLDDIEASIALLERQLAAQTETLTNNNSSLSNECEGLALQVAQLEDQLRKSLIVSPIRGTILTKYAEQGELAAQGRALFKVGDIAHMYLRVYITATQINSVQIGQNVTVYADQGELDRKSYEGVITWISDKAEFTPKTIQTRDERANLVYALKVAVKNDGYIKRGMYGEVTLLESSKQNK